MRHVTPLRYAILKRACCWLREHYQMNGPTRAIERREHGCIPNVGDTVVVRYQSWHRVRRRFVRVADHRSAVADFFAAFWVSLECPGCTRCQRRTALLGLCHNRPTHIA